MKTTRSVRQRSVGVRDAKAQLSRLLHGVQSGEEWIITERGKPIARLVPIIAEQVSLAERLRRLQSSGMIEPSPGLHNRVPPPLPLEHGLARRILDDDRDRWG